MTRTPATSFRQGFLTGQSWKSDEPEGMVEGDYDLIVTTSSWDSRCLALTQLDVRAQSGIGIFFRNRGQLGLRDLHDPEVDQFLAARCESVERIELPSEELDQLWTALWLAASQAYARIGHPMKVLLDLSTCPRYYAMGLIASGFRKGLIRSVTCFYAEGAYPPDPVENPNDQFTTGRWETRDVPALAGTADPGSARLFVVSLGFEGSKTYRVVSSDDPDRVAVLFPDPGVRDDYPERTRINNRLLFEEYGIGNENLVRAPAGDAIAAWAALAGASITRERENAFYLCCGTKPHAVAMALHALLDERTTVLYAKPAAHKETRIAPIGVYWAYEIADVTQPELA